MASKILWNLFHPNFAQSRGNRLLLEQIRDLPNVEVRDLYALYPDKVIDVKAEQEKLVAADLVVFQHPFYWYSVPALFKAWQDLVLEFGFAYPPGVGKALNGKHWLSVITAGGPQWSYQSGGFNNYTIVELLRPLQATANLTGMRWQPPFAVHGVLPPGVEGLLGISDEDLAAAGRRLRAWVEAFDPAERHSLEPLVAPHFLGV